MKCYFECDFCGADFLADQPVTGAAVCHMCGSVDTRQTVLRNLIGFQEAYAQVSDAICSGYMTRAGGVEGALRAVVEAADGLSCDDLREMLERSFK